MQKKRAGLHNGKSSQKTGKVINPKHNDDEREKNENVNEKAVANNVYFNCLDGEYTSKTQSGRHSFNEAELIYYTEHYNEDRKSTRLNSSHSGQSRMPSSA